MKFGNTWGEVTSEYGHNTISMLWGNTAYCMKLNEDLSHYSNEIESVGLRKCPYCRHLTKKVLSR